MQQNNVYSDPCIPFSHTIKCGFTVSLFHFKRKQWDITFLSSCLITNVSINEIVLIFDQSALTIH